MLNKQERRLLIKQESQFEYQGKTYKLSGISFREWWREHLPVKLPNKTYLEVKWSGKPPMPSQFNVLSSQPDCWYEAQEQEAIAQKKCDE